MEESTKLVIDASFVLAFLLPDEEKTNVDETFKKSQQKELNLLSTHLLPFEVFNCLKTTLLRKRIQPELVYKLGEQFLKLDILLQDINYLDLLKLAQKEKLSFYDASYVWLAKSKSLPLLTQDKRMMQLAR